MYRAQGPGDGVPPGAERPPGAQQLPRPGKLPGLTGRRGPRAALLALRPPRLPTPCPGEAWAVCTSGHAQTGGRPSAAPGLGARPAGGRAPPGGARLAPPGRAGRRLARGMRKACSCGSCPPGLVAAHAAPGLDPEFRRRRWTTWWTMRPSRPGIPITRADGQFGLWMARYVCAHLLRRPSAWTPAGPPRGSARWARRAGARGPHRAGGAGARLRPDRPADRAGPAGAGPGGPRVRAHRPRRCGVPRCTRAGTWAPGWAAPGSWCCARRLTAGTRGLVDAGLLAQATRAHPGERGPRRAGGGAGPAGGPGPGPAGPGRAGRVSPGAPGTGVAPSGTTPGWWSPPTTPGRPRPGPSSRTSWRTCAASPRGSRS